MIKFISINPVGTVVRTFNSGHQETRNLGGYVLVLGRLQIWFTWMKKTES